MTAFVDFVMFVALCMAPGFLPHLDVEMRQAPDACRPRPARGVPAEPLRSPGPDATGADSPRLAITGRQLTVSDAAQGRSERTCLLESLADEQIARTPVLIIWREYSPELRERIVLDWLRHLSVRSAVRPTS